MAPELTAERAVGTPTHSNHSSDSPPQPTSSCPKKVGALSLQGKRANNEDRYVIDPENGIYLVADGMGGQEHGERASELAAVVLPHLLQTRLPSNKGVIQVIRDAIAEANQAVVDAGSHQEAGRRMGTTVVVAVEFRSKVYVSGIGDSPAFLVRGETVEQLTIDHTLADALYRNGELSQKEAENSPWQHVLYKFLGCPDMKDRAEVRAFTPEPGDRLVLGSDGLTNELKPDELIDQAKQFEDMQQWAEHLAQNSLKRGSRDNITCVVVAF